MSVEWNAEHVLGLVRRYAMIGVFRGTEKVLATALDKIRQPPKTGRIYRRPDIDHQASAPGEAPANDTGHLAKMGRTEYDTPNLTGIVRFSTAYAEGLELGTERVEARPFLRPSLTENLTFIQEAVRDEIAAGLK